jgi:hypothetical protein
MVPLLFLKYDKIPRAANGKNSLARRHNEFFFARRA